MPATSASDPALRQRLLTFVLVGAGPTGVEMAGALAELAHATLSRDFRNINPQTGFPIQAAYGRDMLVATTYGRGTFAIRLNDSVVVPGTGLPLSSFVVSPVAGPHVVSISPVTAAMPRLTTVLTARYRRISTSMVRPIVSARSADAGANALSTRFGSFCASRKMKNR